MYIAARDTARAETILQLKGVIPKLFDVRLLVHLPDDRNRFQVAQEDSTRSWLETYRNTVDPMERANLISHAFTKSIDGCPGVFKAFGEAAGMAGWANEQYLGRVLPQRIQECDCHGVKLDLFTVVLLAAFDAYDLRLGWFPLSKVPPLHCRTPPILS